MWNAYQRYRSLDPEARKLFRRAAVLLPYIALSLRLRGFTKTKEHLQVKLTSNRPLPTKTGNASGVVEKTGHMVNAAAHYGLLRASCLEQSLALWYLLQKQNVAASLRIGVRKLADSFEAHAWVEYQGAALNQSGEAHRHYAAFDSEFASLPGEKQ